jgi:hypothetical protein
MLPKKLIMDAWWLSDEDPEISAHTTAPLRTKQPSFALLSSFITCMCLLIAADFLFFNHALGLGFVIFMIITACAALILRREHTQSTKVTVSAICILAAGLLPIFVFAQTLSILFLAVACLSFVVLLNAGPEGVFERVKINSRFWITGLFQDIPNLKQEFSQTNMVGLNWKHILRSATLPMIASLIFALLFISANPVLENMSKTINPLGFLENLSTVRFLFWAFVLILIWPIIRYVDHGGSQNRLAKIHGLPRSTLAPFFTRSSIRMTLIISNLLFLIQGGTDIGYLFAGAELPTGMTYAQYAHRGAYPLLATALLAGGITVAVNRFIHKDTLIKKLALLWMVQTLALLGTSVFRLSLYIDAYGLTLLRMWASIWMFLVLFSIVLIIVQIHQIKPVRWLMQRNAIAYGATLYACCFFNFSHAAASYNFSHLDEVDATDYACELGAEAAVAYFQTFGFSKPQACFMNSSNTLKIKNWREWSLRKAWLARELTWIADIENERLPELNNWSYGEREGY